MCSSDLPAHVLDLYCGSGFFSIPLAQQCQELIGIESSRIAVHQARKNARANGVENAKFHEGEVADLLKGTKIRPDLVVLNPPRTGAGKEAAGVIADLQARRIVYVSCNPSTFAREAAILCSKGYRLTQITMIDQFPNTYHIELAAAFSL